MQMNETELLIYNTLKIKEIIGKWKTYHHKTPRRKAGKVLKFGLWQNWFQYEIQNTGKKVKINETTSKYKALQRKGKASIKIKGTGENIS